MFPWKFSERIGAPKYYRLQIFEVKFIISSKVNILSMRNICLHEVNLSWGHFSFFLVNSQDIF